MARKAKKKRLSLIEKMKRWFKGRKEKHANAKVITAHKVDYEAETRRLENDPLMQAKVARMKRDAENW